MRAPAGRALHCVIVHADHHVQGWRVDPRVGFPSVLVGFPEVLNAILGIVYVSIIPPRINLLCRSGGEYLRVCVGRPLIVPRQHPLRRLAQDGDQADVR
eukprot:scaffold112224_cov66-Phaeocystis_antarctica.AAC.1